MVSTGPGPLVETWEWAGETWAQVADQGPKTRGGYATAYDEERHQLVLFGGRLAGTGQSPVGDTWVWDGETWEQAADFGPSARYGHALVFDSLRSRVVLFGGEDGRFNQQAQRHGVANNDTWAWDGRRWEQLQDIGPRPRHEHSMAYDRERDRVVLFGGLTFGGAFGDTWEFGPYD